jgi:hypothetical protein
MRSTVSTVWDGVEPILTDSVERVLTGDDVEVRPYLIQQILCTATRKYVADVEQKQA